METEDPEIKRELRKRKWSYNNRRQWTGMGMKQTLFPPP